MSRIVKNPTRAPTKLYTIWPSLNTHFRQAAVYMNVSQAETRVRSPEEVKAEGRGISRRSFNGRRGNQPTHRKEQDMFGMGRRPILKKAVATVALLAVVMTSGVAFGQAPGDGRRHGPPPEAITACQGKSPGDAVQLQTPRGETIRATWRELRGQLVAMPEGVPPGGPPGPPPEAITACEGKSPGDAVQLQTPRGETIPARCRLVAIPQQ